MWNGEKSGRLIITARHTLNVMVILYTSLVHIRFPQRLASEQDAKMWGSVMAASPEACVWICMSTCDASSRSRRGEMSLWSYLVNAAASDKSFISLILREAARAVSYYAAANLPSRHDTKTQLSLPRCPSSSLPHPKPYCHPHFFALPPSLVWSLKAICEPHSCESTLHAWCTNAVEGKKEKGKSKIQGGRKKMYFILFLGLCWYWVHINFLWPIHAF